MKKLELTDDPLMKKAVDSILKSSEDDKEYKKSIIKGAFLMKGMTLIWELTTPKYSQVIKQWGSKQSH